MIEGEKVYLSSTLFEGEGYSIYITDEEWYQYTPDAWGVFYCYPIGTEEGWGTLLPLIADTFAVSENDV